MTGSTIPATVRHRSAALVQAPRLRAPSRSWVLVTGEYPPKVGGVGAYTRLVARELARRGDTVHVWTGAGPDDAPVADEPGITVHRLPGRFGARGLLTLQRRLAAMRGEGQIVVQYVPQGFGWKGMNLPFCFWLWYRRADRPWVMFHEVALSVDEARGGARKLQARVTRLMARIAYAAADRVFVSIPAWADSLREITADSSAPCWSPIPSCVPGPSDAVAGEARRVRQELAVNLGQQLVGHFGVATYGGGRAVRETLARLLSADGSRHALLVGRHSDQLAAALVEGHPALRRRVHATGVVADEDVSAYLSACTVLIQPYPDGVSTRRTSVMAGLALGLPIVTVDGRLTEPVWRESNAVALVANDDPSALATRTEGLLAEPATLARLGGAAAALYTSQFSIERTVAALLSDPAPAGAAGR